MRKLKRIKKILTLSTIFGLSVAVGYLILSQPSVHTVQIAPERVEIEKTVSELEVRIEDAIRASQGEIEAEAQRAYDDLYELRMTEVENTVIDEYQAELDARKASNTEKVLAY